MRLISIAFFMLTASISFANEIPSAAFGTMPMLSTPMVSPDGKHIAAIFNSGQTTQVIISPFGSDEIRPIAALEKNKFRIEDVNWINNQRVLVKVSEPTNIHVNRRQVRIRLNSLFSISIDGNSTIELKKKGPLLREIDLLRRTPQLLSLLPDDEDHILVTLQDARDNYYTSIFKVNVNNGDFKKYLPNSLKIREWGVDRKGQVRIALGEDENPRSLTTHVYFRKDNSSDWKQIHSYEPYKDETFNPFLYEETTHSLLVITNHKLRKDAIWRYDLKNGTFTDLVGEAPGTLDISAPIFRKTKHTKELIGFSYINNFVEHVYLDKTSSEAHEKLQSAFSNLGLKAHIYSKAQDGNHQIIYAISDNSPGKFYLYDRNKKSIKLWFSQYPSLENKNLPHVKPFSFKARDGMELHGYLTKSDTDSRPLVVFPHGGPHARDNQYFDPLVQMFANSGFAVLQVNFRGSYGYGDDYLTAGYKEWGKAMQDDLVDAVHWVKENSLADTDNACIVGASYGGYAALVAGYKTPKLFKCIVSIAGISDIQDMISYDSVRGYNDLYKEELADIHSSEDLKDIESNSAINFADEFEAPVLLIHGKSDTRVSYRQSEEMGKALKDAGKAVKLSLLDHGTHSLNDPVNREHAMTEVIAFLEEHLYPVD